MREKEFAARRVLFYILKVRYMERRCISVLQEPKKPSPHREKFSFRLATLLEPCGRSRVANEDALRIPPALQELLRPPFRQRS